MQKLKWGEIPLGTMVMTNDGDVPMLVLSRTSNSVSLLDLYNNRVARRKASTQANVTFNLQGK